MWPVINSPKHLCVHWNIRCTLRLCLQLHLLEMHRFLFVEGKRAAKMQLMDTTITCARLLLFTLYQSMANTKQAHLGPPAQN